LGRAIDRPYALRVHVPEPLVWTIGGISDLTARLLKRPAALSIDKVREAVAGDWTCNDARIRRELGFAPAKSLPERVQETAQWYREAGWL
jgi:nucleoside-diphosphate-sugar epimerase